MRLSCVNSPKLQIPLHMNDFFVESFNPGLNYDGQNLFSFKVVGIFKIE
jgi:hypothetical protein